MASGVSAVAITRPVRSRVSKRSTSAIVAVPPGEERRPEGTSGIVGGAGAPRDRGSAAARRPTDGWRSGDGRGSGRPGSLLADRLPPPELRELLHHSQP